MMGKRFGSGLREFALWSLCGVIVLATHGAIAAWLVMASATDDSDSTAGAVVIELAPMLAAPANDQVDLPPGPDQVQSEAAVAVQAEKIEEKTEKPEDPKPVENDLKITDSPKSDIELDSGAPKPFPNNPCPRKVRCFSL